MSDGRGEVAVGTIGLMGTTDDPLQALQIENVPYCLASYSSLDRYFGVGGPGSVYVVTDASLITLAKLFEDLRYPGLPLEDAAVETDDTRYIFRCVDRIAEPPSVPYTVLRLLYNPERRAFLDPLGIYRDLRRTELVAGDGFLPEWVFLFEASKLVSHYHYEVGGVELWSPEAVSSFPSEAAKQQELLVSVVCSRYPCKGLSLLKESGFLEAFWPELHQMINVPQSKDFHPEGDVWEHTLAALRQRKRMDLTLSLALLLHDIGKPHSGKSGDRQFDGHAEGGATIAGRFLRRLGFSASLVSDVQFAVRYHMIPQALKRLPLYRVENLLDSPLFPLLLEVYKADISASYHALDGYYEACRVYKRYLKKKASPFGQSTKGNSGVSSRSRRLRRRWANS